MPSGHRLDEVAGYPRLVAGGPCSPAVFGMGETDKRYSGYHRVAIDLSTYIWTEYLQHRVHSRGFSLAIIEHILRFSRERYFDTVTQRTVVDREIYLTMNKPKMFYFEEEDILHVVMSNEEEANCVELSPNITAELKYRKEN